MLRSACDLRAFDPSVPEVQTPSQVWTYCLDSHNIIRPGPLGNPTNDIVLNVKMTADRQLFRSMELVTAEIPMPDFLECRLRVQRDLHLPMREEERTLRRLDGQEYVLPPTWNRVDYEGDGVYRTESAHRLDCAAGYMWLWGGCEPCLLAHANGDLRHAVCVLGSHTFKVEHRHSDHALYVWSPPLTFRQIAHWLGDDYTEVWARLQGFVMTPLYRRLTTRHDAELVCHIPCVRRSAKASELKDLLQICSNVTKIDHKTSISVTDYCGCELVHVVLEPGYFNPEGLCKELTRGHVRACIERDRLCFRSNNGEPFRVKFKGRGCDGTFFGFVFDELNGQTFYEADKALRWDLQPMDWSVVNCSKLAVSRPPVKGKGQLNDDKISFKDTHGFYVNDAVIIKVGDESRLTRVVHIGLQWIEVDKPHGWCYHDTKCTVESFPAPLFLFGADVDPMLGHMYQAPSGAWLSAQPVDIRGQTYVMMQIVEPSGSAQCEHLSADGNLTGYIGKCVFMSLFRTLDEHAPRVFKFFSNRKVSELHVRLLNPDGSLYNLQGMHWSATLLFRT